MTSYSELAPGSLKAAKVEHGLQTTAIYWESQMNPFRGAFGQATYGQKWSWALVDDSIRQSLGLDQDVRNHPYVFHNDSAFDRGYVRQYYGDRNVYDVVPTKKAFNFSFFPTGTKDAGETQATGEVSRADVFKGVLNSCLKVDIADSIQQ